MSDADAEWFEVLKVCIKETVAMRHPRPLEHIALMLVDPSFKGSLSLPTADYVQQHNIEEHITSALEVAGFDPGRAVPPGMLSRLSDELLRPAHSKSVKAAVQVAQTKLESTPLSSEDSDGNDDATNTWSCRTWASSLPLSDLIVRALCGPVEDLVKDWPAHTRSAAELAYVRRLFEDTTQAELAALLQPALAGCTNALMAAGRKLNEVEVRAFSMHSVQPGPPSV